MLNYDVKKTTPLNNNHKSFASVLPISIFRTKDINIESKLKYEHFISSLIKEKDNRLSLKKLLNSSSLASKLGIEKSRYKYIIDLLDDEEISSIQLNKFKELSKTLQKESTLELKLNKVLKQLGFKNFQHLSAELKDKNFIFHKHKSKLLTNYLTYNEINNEKTKLEIEADNNKLVTSTLIIDNLKSAKTTLLNIKNRIY